MRMTRREFLSGLSCAVIAGSIATTTGCTITGKTTEDLVIPGALIANGTTIENDTLADLLEWLIKTDEFTRIRGLVVAECPELESIENLGEHTRLPAGLEITFRYVQAMKIVRGDNLSGQTVGDIRREHNANVIIVNNGNALELNDAEPVYSDDWIVINPGESSRNST